MTEIEHEEEEEITPPSFALDDLTVEVSQYGEEKKSYSIESQTSTQWSLQRKMSMRNTN